MLNIIIYLSTRQYPLGECTAKKHASHFCHTLATEIILPCFTDFKLDIRTVTLFLTFQGGSCAQKRITQTRGVASTNKQLIFSGRLQVLQQSLGSISLDRYLLPLTTIGRFEGNPVLKDISWSSPPCQFHRRYSFIKDAKVTRGATDWKQVQIDQTLIHIHCLMLKNLTSEMHIVIVTHLPWWCHLLASGPLRL